MFIVSLDNFTGTACGLSFRDGRAETDDSLLAARMKLRGYHVETAAAAPDVKSPEEPKSRKSGK